MRTACHRAHARSDLTRGFQKRPDPRERVFFLGDRLTLNVLPLRADLDAVAYESEVVFFLARLYRGQTTNLRTVGEPGARLGRSWPRPGPSDGDHCDRERFRATNTVNGLPLRQVLIADTCQPRGNSQVRLAAQLCWAWKSASPLL